MVLFGGEVNHGSGRAFADSFEHARAELVTSLDLIVGF
jgi:hypothetical protein